MLSRAPRGRRPRPESRKAVSGSPQRRAQLPVGGALGVWGLGFRGFGFFALKVLVLRFKGLGFNSLGVWDLVLRA